MSRTERKSFIIDRQIDFGRLLAMTTNHQMAVQTPPKVCLFSFPQDFHNITFIQCRCAVAFQSFQHVSSDIAIDPVRECLMACKKRYNQI